MSDEDEFFVWAQLTPDLKPALTELGKALTSAFDETHNDPSDMRLKRARYINALVGVAKFLQRIEAPRAQANALVELASALSDLNEGAVRPFLQPIKAQNRPPDTSDKWRLRADVCVGIHALMATGMTKRAAAEYIGRNHKVILRLTTLKSRNLIDTIVSWEDTFSTGRVKNFEGAAAYENNVDFVRAQISAFPQSERLAAAERIVAGCAERVSRI